MTKTLIITEKPSVAMDIAKVLPENFNRQDGYLEGDTKIISWAVGHLIELAMPQDYNAKYEKWDIEDLPIIPEQFILKPKSATVKQLNILKNLLQRTDITNIINACDAGREGELIFRYIMQYTNCTKPHQRLWLSETTDKAVRNAFNNLKGSSEVENLSKAAIARSQADWLVGLNATRAYTTKNFTKLSVGRVQTPTLAILVNRELEIENFKPTTYFEIEADFGYKAKWFKNNLDRFSIKAEAEAVFKKFLKNDKGIITKVEEKELRENPPMLYNLNDLQKDANKILGLTANQTLEVAQNMYENKLITYPRTDCRHLSTALADTMGDRLNALKNTELAEFIEQATEDIRGKKRYVDDSKITDHTAIIITDNKVDLNSLSENEKQVYLLVARRTLAIFFPNSVTKKVEIITSCQNETFLTKGSVILMQGWRRLIKDEEKDDNILPNVQEGQEVILDDISLLEKETSPPKRFTEGDLLSAMENVSKRIQDEELKEVMTGKGLGTPATRAGMIERLINVGYVERKKKLLVPTEKGKYLISIVSEEMANPETTAEWEYTLLEIEKGNYSDKEFLNNIKQFTLDIVNEVKNMEIKKDFKKDIISIGNCPLCNRPVIENKKGYGCSGYKEGCKFVVWKEVAGKKVSEAQAVKLIKDGKTGLIKGFKSKKGNDFDAHLKYDKQENKIVFEFAEKK